MNNDKSLEYRMKVENIFVFCSEHGCPLNAVFVGKIEPQINYISSSFRAKLYIDEEEYFIYANSDSDQRISSFEVIGENIPLGSNPPGLRAVSIKGIIGLDRHTLDYDDIEIIFSKFSG